MDQGARPSQAITPQNLAEEEEEEIPAGMFTTLPENTDGEQHIEPCIHADPPDAFHTCPHPYHLQYSTANLPPLLFRLKPPELVPYRFTDVKLLRDNGHLARDYDGYYIRDFWFLPRYISRFVPPWLIEFWMRSDSRLVFRDIKVRMPVPKRELPNDRSLMNTLENDVRRPLGLSYWGARKLGVPSMFEMERAARLSYDQITYNTTMRVEYCRRTSIPIYLVDRSFDLSTAKRFELGAFLGDGPRHAPTPHIRKCIDELFNMEPRTGVFFDPRRSAMGEPPRPNPLPQQQ